MAQDVSTQRSDQIAERIDKSIAGTMTVGGSGITFANAGEVMEFAKMMATAGSSVPAHLRGLPGACLGIIDDALRFKMNPFALARKSFFVKDNLAYEAQVINAIINAWAPLKDAPDVSYSGAGQDRVCTVTGEQLNGKIRTYVSPPLRQITPKNSPLWVSDPDQQLHYYSTRAFARRWFPQILLGIYEKEEIEGSTPMKDVTPEPAKSGLAGRLKPPTEDAKEGFSRAHVDLETSDVTDQGQNIEMEVTDQSIEQQIDEPRREEQEVVTGTSITAAELMGDIDSREDDEEVIEEGGEGLSEADKLVAAARAAAEDGVTSWLKWRKANLVDDETKAIIEPHRAQIGAFAKARDEDIARQAAAD